MVGFWAEIQRWTHVDLAGFAIVVADNLEAVARAAVEAAGHFVCLDVGAILEVGAVGVSVAGVDVGVAPRV